MNDEREVEQAKQRSAVIRALMGAGLSREDANITVDLSMQAVKEAQAALIRVCDTAPVHLRAHIVANAMVGVADACANGVKLMQGMGIQMKEVIP